MYLILQDGFQAVNITLVSMVKFKFLAQYPMDHFLHPVVSSLILYLHYFATFAYNMTDHFVSITT